ncbi:hypothetical protein JTE90_006373 [Oedothorax gibbosus]|uniref:DNA-dependent protein kinase catalytic subunit n=1 Tax=Oedothorax gibbosus TaxID=931172 RepID=A0AAV6VYK8_9ARAC|nr:hypothetical protein JTE90_006373 [Oedothorax gibbosus]
MGEIIDLIRRQLETLNATGCVASNSTRSSNEGTISDIIKTIRDNYINYNFKQQDREIVNAHLLSEEEGILGFLKSILLFKEFYSIKKECFKLLYDIMNESKSLAEEYGHVIMAIGLLYVKHIVPAELKKQVLVTLSMVLETCHGCHTDNRIDVKSLVEDLFFQLSLGSKLTATVKEEILKLIGFVAHYFPQEFIPYQERVLDMYLQELKLQMNAKAKATNYNTVSGCLSGLKEYLYNFSVLYSEETEKSFLIFDVSRKVASNTAFKFSSNKAGLHLLAAHAPQFGLCVFENCIELYCDLMEWIDRDNREMQKLGREAVVSILKVTSEMVLSQFEENENYCKKVFKYFMNQFREIFLTSTKPKELQIAVIGYGLFAGPCKLCLSGSEVKTMLQNVIQKCEYEFLSENGVDDKILDLSCYVESLSSIVNVIEYIPENTIFSLEKITVYQIDKFPKVPTAYNFIASKAIIRMLLSVQSKRESFVGFLTQIVYQGIVKTCSHPVIVEAEALKDKASVNGDNLNQYEPKSSMKIVTYKDYIDMWKTMLNVVKLKELNSLGIPLEHRQQLMESIYDEIIRSSLSLLSKLDLSMKQSLEKDKEDSEEEASNISSDPLHGLLPNNMVDYYIFINLVDFLRDLLTDTCTKLFTKWVFVFGKEIIFLAAKHSYHSGFYKLVSLTFEICSQIEFFKDFHPSTNNSLSRSSKLSEAKSFHLFSKFVREVSVRQQQFKGDLLASGLQVMLTLPIEIVLQEMNVLVPALEGAFKLGMSYLPLASAAISALEKWSENIPLETMKPHYSQILPHLNDYLLASGIQEGSAVAEKVKKQNINKAQKMSTELSKRFKKQENTIEDPAWLRIQHKIIRFLGRLGENNMALLEKSYKQLDEKAIAWDTLYCQHLKYSVPFVDMKLDIYFDDFLPRILEIATKSSVRQVKVAACETLHSLVLFMIGRGSILSGKMQEQFSMEALYKKLFPGLLELACDVEQVTNQLYRPLVLQMIHWFSYSKVAKSRETSVILLSLWDGVTNQQNAALRDFSALCLKEFFVWSIKQTAKGEKAKATENLLNKLHSFSLHPNPFKRMGAALTFNNIYAIFREEEILVKEYTIQLLVQFVDSLAIAHTDDISLGTQKQCLDALNHIEKILVYKHNWLVETTENRKKPECLEEANLKSVIYWLLRQIGCIQTECRHKCMGLAAKLAPFVPGFKSMTFLLITYKRHNKNIIEDVFENVLQNFAQSQFNDQISFKSVVFWLEALQTSMECYQWAFSKQLMLQNELQETQYSSMVFSVKIFKAIEYFIENLSKNSLMGLGNRENRGHQEDVFSAEEVLKFNKIKCTVLVRLLHFVVSVFDPDAKWFHDQFYKVVWSSSLWEIIMLCVVDPTVLGFDITDVDVSTQLPNEVSIVIKKCLRRSDFKEFCLKYIHHKAEYNILKLIPISLQDTKTNYSHLMQLMGGYELLINNGLEVSDIFKDSENNQIISSFLDTIWNDSVTTDGLTVKKVGLSPSAFILAEKMLSLCYHLGLKVDEITQRLLKTHMSAKDSKLNKEKGLLLFNIFAESICTFASETPHDFLKSAVSFLNTSTFSEISILLKFVDYVSSTKILRRKHGPGVIEAFLSCWENIISWSQAHPDTDSAYLVLSIITKLLMIDSKVALNLSGKYSISLFPTYISLLRMQDTSMPFIVTALEALPFFLEESPDAATLRACIEEMMAVRFPLQSTELLAGSSAYHTYISAIKRLLMALSLTGCDFLLEILALFFCKESHILEEDFKRSLVQMIKGKDPRHHQKFADTIFALFRPSNLDLCCTVGLNLSDKVMLYILQNIKISPLINFYSTHITAIMSNVKESTTIITAMKDLFLMRKIANFKLLQLMYQNLTKDLLNTNESQIVEKYLGKKPEKGNELTREIISLCLEFKRTSYETEPEHKELLRKLNCARYNVLIAVFSCVTNDLKFYDSYAFKETSPKNEFIWERIIDVDSKLTFEMEIDPATSRKNKFISLRHSLRNGSSEVENEMEQNDLPSSLQLLGSENLGMSSLAEDVSKFVFSTTEPAFTNGGGEKSTDVKTTVKHFEGSFINEVIELEDDELNRHECMAPLCCLLQHMKKHDLIPEESVMVDSSPKWLSCIIQTLQDGKTSENVKLFLGRLIINNAKILQPFAKFLIEPMLDLIIMGTAGFTLNYYILDVILTLLSWAPAAIPEKNGIPKASEVLKFIITNCEHSRKDIFRNNLEIIKTMLECWKSGLVIPYNLIYEKMKDPNLESRKNVCGIQLLGVVLSCDFPPYDIENEASEQSYLSILLKNISYKYKEVYGSASEVIALALRNILKNSENVQNHSFFKNVVHELDVLKNKGHDKFLYCLSKVHLGCPAVADKFIPKLLSLYPTVHGSFKNYVLEILYSRVKDMKNAYQELKYIDLFEGLEKKAEITQLLSLQILEKLLPDLSCDDILHILPDLVVIHNQPSSSSRLALYRILFVLFEKYSGKDGAKEKEIARYAQDTLLIGLADSDPAIRLTVDNFWSDEKRLPKGTKDRLIALMKNMYSPLTEESFLQYSTFLLLERTSHSPDYKRTIFEHPLSQCNFQAYKIQTSARSRHMIMSPLFTETVSNSTFSSLMSMEATFDQDMKLRATQHDVQFSETMEVDEDIKKMDTYNWLTGTADTFAMQDFSSESGYGSFASTLTKSHLIANKGDLKLSGRGLPNASIKSDEKKYQKSPAQMLRRRFLKDNRQNDSEAFARQELRRQDRRKELQKDQRSHRDAQVVMYRQYRIGELPDIQISNSAIIQPIQALAMHDTIIAKLLLRSLLTAVCKSVEEEFPEGFRDFNSEIAMCFENILCQSSMYMPYVISFCLESLYQLPDLRYDEEAVFNACIRSSQQSIGILLLEAKVSDDFEPACKKKRTNSHGEALCKGLSEAVWMKLAELYRSIDAYDVANGIFSIRFGYTEESRRALQHECSGQYFEAVVLYNQLYDKTGEQAQGEKDFWDKSILSCFNKLCRWDDLEKSVISRFPGIDSPDLQSTQLWQDPYMKENYLPYLIRSKMKKLLEGKKDNFLLKFFDVARQEEETKVYVENHFSEQLALLYICQDQFDIAKHYSSSALNRFLKEWQNLSPLAVEMQHAHLQHLVKYVELDDFLELIRKNKFVDTSYTVNVLKIWQKRFPNSIDSVEIWDDVITNRHLFMSKLEKNMPSQTEKMDLSESLQIDSGSMDNDSQEEFDFNKLTSVTSVYNKLSIAENCAAQGNFSVAIKMLKSIYKSKDKKALDGDMWSNYIISYCSINNKRCHFVPEEKLNILLTSWEQLNKLEIRCGESVSQKKLHSQTFELLAKMFMKNEIEPSSITSEHKKKILEISQGKSEQTQVISTILDQSFSCLKSIIQSTDLITNPDCEIEANRKNRASAYIELANFCNRYLTKDTVHGYSPQSIPSFSEFPKVLIESLLDALKLGSREATILFPRLLQIIETYPSCLEIFKERISKMPCWLFIGWIDQMVALLDKPEGEAVHEIVENIALSYPNAIVYAFHLSYKSYDFSKCEKGPYNKVFVEKIKSTLEKHTLITDFVSALEHLSVPSIYFKDYVVELVRLISIKAEESDIKLCFKTMCNALLEVPDDSVCRSVPIGPVQKKFTEEMKSQVFDVCGADGSKLVQRSNSKKMIDQLQKLIPVAKGIDDKASKLAEVSPWLSEFQQWKYSSQIEIPGQYSGKSKPLPEYHVKVAGFDEKILVLSSVASPRRITIRGNDEKEYKILVKSGEDLRQDARIQQMFSVMNEIYAGDVNCAKRRLGLHTYKVVPLSNRLGIIEWVDNTTVLMDFIKDGMSEIERKKCVPPKVPINMWQSEFNKWANPGKSRKFGEVYSNIYLNKTREECLRKYEDLVNMVPKSLLLKSFLKLSSSPEAFVVLRTKFAQSHAVICLSHWITGIGDRHLGNFLIDKSSGCEIGIDFGHAFGSATQFLAVPELLPFRLTPQYLQLMAPMGVKGIYEATMVHALSAIRDKKDLLLSVMDIFIKEPTLDWKVQANKQLQGMGIDPQEKKDDWFPQQRITIARRKLEGYNPCRIISKELELGHKSNPAFEKMKAVCLGDPENEVRANMKKSDLTVQEQVDCLINMATDPHASLLIYFGWNPWI